MRHPTPRTTHPIHHRNTTTISKMGPTISGESAKAQGLKAQPVNGSEPPRATNARDEATQRMTNILVPSSFVSESRSGGFLHALCGLASSHPGFLRGLLGKEARNHLV
jgi:hypothetical protein